jgi:hypothetical protein
VTGTVAGVGSGRVAHPISKEVEHARRRIVVSFTRGKAVKEQARQARILGADCGTGRGRCGVSFDLAGPDVGPCAVCRRGRGIRIRRHQEG